uniref:PREDICTED: similar to tigger transposable element derived 4 putative n=1 Tax=Albugo laibachii Nc14 TaxID=890382 RepID=F0W6F0_9STRA|nr:PREDICTED: similar to tigger transposable element derived 4 putative [Albugo laibachii Nc14]|eukprot:CCA16694.1 PREDICTED: similar to tigger transposable element derived 4 putative [Albugo laibachii Nc14]
MDESVYFYCTASSSTVSHSSVAGRKKVKKRLTIAITTNEDGSFQVPLLFMGTAEMPRCFGCHTVAEVGINYTNAAKGWMTTTIFRTWLGYFSDTMRSQDRHVLLLDNASPHRVTDHYSLVKLHFLPPNTTSHLQPQDADIIKSFKSQLSKIRDNSVVDKLDAMLEQVDGVGVEDIDKRAEQLYNVSILVAMRWAQQAWNKVTKATVVNCWSHTGILAANIYQLASAMNDLSIAPKPANYQDTSLFNHFILMFTFETLYILALLLLFTVENDDCTCKTSLLFCAEYWL